jgi:hypothetical protein
MFLTKLKTSALVVCALVVASGGTAGVLAQQGPALGDSPASAAQAPPEPNSGQPPTAETRSPQNSAAVLNDAQERRLRELERKVEQLLQAQQGQVRTRTGSPVPQLEPAPAQPFDPEDAHKAAMWARLTADGFICRFDTEDVPPAGLYTKLYRRYVGRRPSREELMELLEWFGPGFDSTKGPPEVIVRQLLENKKFMSSPLQAAILRQARSEPQPATSKR